jgi:hypothetical protein
MNDRDRLEHLRGLLDRLERMPASAHRDWVLSEVRRRAVDVETGVTPAAVRALPLDDANAELAVVEAAPVEAIAAPARRKRIRVKTPRRATGHGAGSATRERPAVAILPSSLAVVRERGVRGSVVDLLQPGGLLCLGDPPADAAAAIRPWACGLRG